jgi:endonuclease-3
MTTKVLPRRSCRTLNKSKRIKSEAIIAGTTVSSNHDSLEGSKVKVEPVMKVKQEHSVHSARKNVKKERRSKKIVKKSHVGGNRPTADECRYATVSLSKLHPDVVNKNDTKRQTMLESCGMRDSITDSVISTMLSQNTTDANSKAAWANLKQRFPDWEAVANCEDIALIEDTIRVAGLAKTRAERIQNILRITKSERGEASLDYIRDLNDEEIKRELSRFKGLGPKTISCVLLFALGRDEFPVDTHVLRITQKMGWVSSGTSREGAYEYLNEMIPNDVKMDLHCLLVRHGKVCHRCAANGRPQFPPEGGEKLDCPLVNVSSWAGKVPMQHKKLPTGKKVKDEFVPDKIKSEIL